MRKIAVLNDIPEFARILAAPLREQGYDMLTEVASIDFERLLRFAPDLIILCLNRRRNTFNRPLKSIEEDVIGFKPLVEMEQYPAINIIPILLVTTGLNEQDLPTTVNYDAFLTLPEDAHLYYSLAAELVQTVKSRRKISGFICPNCGSRLTFTVAPARNLFCPRCHTGVVIVNDDSCLVTKPDEVTGLPAPISALRLRPGETSDQAATRTKHQRDASGPQDAA
jgi:CheY-like chemotaxis protein